MKDYSHSLLFSRYLGYFFLFLLYIGCHKETNGQEIVQTYVNAMTIGEKLTAPTPQPDIYHDDLIHPCVRYIPEGFAGHKWWLVATPYYGGLSEIENPILYYGDSRPGNLPPLSYTATCIVAGNNVTGYNSDPCLYYDGKKLWIFWRENYTPACTAAGVTRATVGVYTKDGYTFSKKKIFAKEPSSTEDHEMCPIVSEVNGKIKLFACHHMFTPQRIPLGISIWDIENNDLENAEFTKTIDLLPKYKSGFDFWHFDIFTYKNMYYCVVTPENADQILLGESSDGLNFKFWDTPLISSAYTGANYLYKPSATVLNGIFYLWYPIQEPNSTPRTTRLWMSSINFETLLSILRRQQVS
jgi:hypothetical protein